MKQTALDEFVEQILFDWQEYGNTGTYMPWSLGQACEVAWYTARPKKQMAIKLDSRYRAYCKEQDDREVVNARMYEDLSRVNENLEAQEVLRQSLGLPPSPYQIVDDEADRLENERPGMPEWFKEYASALEEAWLQKHNPH